MGQFELVYTYPIYNDNKVVQTTVQIRSKQGNTIITVNLSKDIREKNSEVIVYLALEQFYQEVFPNRAENERFDKMDKLLKEAGDTLEITRKTMAQSVIKEFENETKFSDIHSKLEFLAKHLKVEFPHEEEDEDEESGATEK